MNIDRSSVRILVFHRAVGFVHLSIPDAVAAIERLGEEHGFSVDATDDPARFTDDLGFYDALVFVHTSGNVLAEPSQRAALERYMVNGGGFFGIHAASSMAPDVGTDWPWFRDLVGASFKGHTVARIFSDDPVPERPGVVYGGPVADAPADADRWSDDLAVMSCEAATVRVESGCDHWVVFDVPTEATCVEPQSGPPDAFNLTPHVVTPETPLTRSATISW